MSGEREAAPPASEGHQTQPTVWPVTVGAGVTMLLFGVLGGWLFSLAGLALLFLGVAGWIGELRRETAHSGRHEAGRE